VLGPVPSGPKTLPGAVLLIGVGILGLGDLAVLLRGIQRKKIEWPKILFFAIVLTFFLIAGLVELTELH
jgi:hypothetical protein